MAPLARETVTVQDMIETLLGLLVMMGVPVAYVWLQVCALRDWRGLWRFPALVPVGIVGIAAVTAGIGLSKGQNLAPLLVVFGMVVALVWLVLAGFVRARLAG